MIDETANHDRNCNHNVYFISKQCFVTIMYSLDTKEKKPTITFKSSLLTLVFSRFIVIIFSLLFQLYNTYITLKMAEEIYTDSLVEVGESKQICADILEWNHSQNINQIICDYAPLSTQTVNLTL